MEPTLLTLLTLLNQSRSRPPAPFPEMIVSREFTDTNQTMPIKLPPQPQGHNTPLPATPQDSPTNQDVYNACLYNQEVKISNCTPIYLFNPYIILISF